MQGLEQLSVAWGVFRYILQGLRPRHICEGEGAAAQQRKVHHHVKSIPKFVNAAYQGSLRHAKNHIAFLIAQVLHGLQSFGQVAHIGRQANRAEQLPSFGIAKHLRRQRAYTKPNHA